MHVSVVLGRQGHGHELGLEEGSARAGPVLYAVGREMS